MQSEKVNYLAKFEPLISVERLQLSAAFVLPMPLTPMLNNPETPQQVSTFMAP
jgi:hypothetical protein